MALADWDIILGGGLGLSDKYKVSGNKSLTQGFNGGTTHIVHKNTYNDAPLNVQIDTWMTVGENDSQYSYFIGAIARKQPDVDTYIYWLLDIAIYYDGEINRVNFDYGYYENGTQNSIESVDVTNEFTNICGNSWTWGTWRWLRMVGYESGGKFTVSISITPDIASPDASNPPEDQLNEIINRTFDLPDSLKNGGACGLVVGGAKGEQATKGQPYYDYTQIYY